jgi:hypothetical protein
MFEIVKIGQYNKGYKVRMVGGEYPLRNYLRRTLMGGTREKWSHDWSYEDAQKVVSNLETRAISHIEKFKEMEASLPSKWLLCEYGNHMYRAATVEGASYLGPHDINGQEACWPCYDGHFDCCYGATYRDFENAPVSSNFKKLLRWRIHRDELKKFRQENRSNKSTVTAPAGWRQGK